MTNPAPSPVLEARAIAVRLAGRLVLNDVSIAIAPGDLVAVAGPNGAGKSTLLRALAGLTPVSAGEVRVDGGQLAKLRPSEIARRIAYLPQDRTVHWPIKASAVVALGRLPHGSGPGRGESACDHDHIAAAMRATDTTELADRIISELSGGERARVLIARALAQDTGIILADEPAAGLDPAHALALFETFKRIAASGRAVVVALHDLSLALRYCPRTLLVKNGVIAAAGMTRDVLTEAQIANVYGVSAAVGEIGGIPAVLPVAVLTSFGQQPGT